MWSSNDMHDPLIHIGYQSFFRKVLFMTLRIFFLMLSFFPSRFAAAQVQVIATGGVTINHFQMDVSRLSNTINRSKPGFATGVGVLAPVNNWLAISTGATILQKNYCLERTGIYEGLYQSFHNIYLQLPVAARFVLHKGRWEAFAEAGVYAAYWLSGRVSGTIPDVYWITDSVHADGSVTERSQVRSFNEKYQFDGRRDQRLEFGWVGSVGAAFDLTHRCAIWLQYGYTRSQTSRYKSSTISAYNDTQSFALGGRITLPHHPNHSH